MQFEMWSIWHYLYVLSPFIILAAILLLTRNSSDKTKRIISVAMGVISILILVTRNVDILISSGIDHEVIPIQVCHIGSVIVGLALIFRKKWLMLVAFCFNLIPAILAMVFADSLANYDTILKIRAQAYVWGHIFIVVGALYGIVENKGEFTKKDLAKSLIFVCSCLIVAIFLNSAFRHWFEWEPNYFYLFNYEGTPLKFLYQVVETSRYGWFEINWFYTLSLIAFFMALYVGLYFVANLINKIKKH